MRTTSANHVIHAVILADRNRILADRNRILAAAASIITNVRSREDKAHSIQSCFAIPLRLRGGKFLIVYKRTLRSGAHR